MYVGGRLPLCTLGLSIVYYPLPLTGLSARSYQKKESKRKKEKKKRKKNS